MFRRVLIIFGLLASLTFSVSCTNKKVQNPLANLGSKQPDKVLFDRAMDALKHNKFDVARLSLQTLINTYPDSEYIARAKLAVGDSWYAEGGTAPLQQAEVEYKDFITFFPNLPESAEAQLKIANIHYQQMEKPDRDFTHAMRAEDEYRQLILQYPDSKIVPAAKERLREVQEVLAEREFRIGRFYYLRQSYPAAIARLREVTDRYQLYSGSDEVLYMLGQAYESEVEAVRMRRGLAEVAKGRLIKQFTDQATEAYSRILTRYPVMQRAEDAKRRLIALHRPVPNATSAAIAQNKQEEESRLETGMFGKLMHNFSKHPDTAQTARVGEPALVDSKPTSATEVVAEATRALTVGNSASKDSHSVAAEVVRSGEPPPNQPIPHSGDAPAAAASGDNSAPAASAETPAGTEPAATTNAGASNAPADSDPNTGIQELAPNVAPENSGGTTPGTAPSSDQPATAPPQVNDAATPAPAPPQVNDAEAASSATSGNTTTSGETKTDSNTAQNSSGSNQDDSKNVSSSRKKKKKHKLIPF
jgi:outer membrane protein assembly factor BamD